MAKKKRNRLPKEEYLYHFTSYWHWKQIERAGYLKLTDSQLKTTECLLKKSKHVEEQAKAGVMW